MEGHALNNERTATLLATLEACATAQANELASARGRVAALREQNRRLEARNRELEDYSHELERQAHELEQQHHELALKHQALEAKCRELEEKFARAPHTADGHAHPRSQGLAALLSHRVRPAPQEPPSQEAAFQEPSFQEEAPSPVFHATPGRAASSGGAPDVSDTFPSKQEPAAEEVDAADQVGDAQADDGSAQTSLPIGEAPSPQALLSQWYRRYPDAFFKGHTRPLKVGIHEDLLDREPWPEKLVRRALACYVHLPRYLKAVREGAERAGLDGEAAGPVSEGEARYARKKLEELRAQQQAERSGKAMSSDGKPRVDKKGADNKRADKNGANKKGGGKKRQPPGRQQGGAGLGSAPAGDAASHQGAPRQEVAAASSETAVAGSSSEAPAERLERKLGALLAKHSSR
ncbi:ProQ/FINO family protein [Onishia taeanensis]|uniref:ProQ/FINO family protein n=1 Tax=Onishia taeanensis TaxID=284577 RepID=A0A1G7N2J2_9GAMM|nr:ProQ/FINO family protein [Halomonas taeanensis]